MLLKHFGITQTKFAESLGMKHTAVINWQSGKTQLPQSTKLAIQAVYGVRWQWWNDGGEMRLSKADHLPDDLKELADLWPRLSEGDRQYILGAAEGRVAKVKK